jgi:hypothetical protein
MAREEVGSVDEAPADLFRAASLHAHHLPRVVAVVAIRRLVTGLAEPFVGRHEVAALP